MNNTYQIYSFELYLNKSITFWFEGTTIQKKKNNNNIHLPS